MSKNTRRAVLRPVILTEVTDVSPVMHGRAHMVFLPAGTVEAIKKGRLTLNDVAMIIGSLIDRDMVGALVDGDEKRALEVFANYVRFFESRRGDRVVEHPGIRRATPVATITVQRSGKSTHSVSSSIKSFVELPGVVAQFYTSGSGEVRDAVDIPPDEPALVNIRNSEVVAVGEPVVVNTWDLVDLVREADGEATPAVNLMLKLFAREKWLLTEGWGNDPYKLKLIATWMLGDSRRSVEARSLLRLSLSACEATALGDVAAAVAAGLDDACREAIHKLVEMGENLEKILDDVKAGDAVLTTILKSLPEDYLTLKDVVRGFRVLLRVSMLLRRALHGAAVDDSMYEMLRNLHSAAWGIKISADTAKKQLARLSSASGASSKEWFPLLQKIVDAVELVSRGIDLVTKVKPHEYVRIGTDPGKRLVGTLDLTAPEWEGARHAAFVTVCRSAYCNRPHVVAYSGTGAVLNDLLRFAFVNGNHYKPVFFVLPADSVTGSLTVPAARITVGNRNVLIASTRRAGWLKELDGLSFNSVEDLSNAIKEILLRRGDTATVYSGRRGSYDLESELTPEEVPEWLRDPKGAVETLAETALNAYLGTVRDYSRVLNQPIIPDPKTFSATGRTVFITPKSMVRDRVYVDYAKAAFGDDFVRAVAKAAGVKIEGDAATVAGTTPALGILKYSFTPVRIDLDSRVRELLLEELEKTGYTREQIELVDSLLDRADSLMVKTRYATVALGEGEEALRYCGQTPVLVISGGGRDMAALTHVDPGAFVSRLEDEGIIDTLGNGYSLVRLNPILLCKLVTRLAEHVSGSLDYLGVRVESKHNIRTLEDAWDASADVSFLTVVADALTVSCMSVPDPVDYALSMASYVLGSSVELSQRFTSSELNRLRRSVEKRLRAVEAFEVDVSRFFDESFEEEVVAPYINLLTDEFRDVLFEITGDSELCDMLASDYRDRLYGYLTHVRALKDAARRLVFVYHALTGVLLPRARQVIKLKKSGDDRWRAVVDRLMHELKTMFVGNEVIDGLGLKDYQFQEGLLLFVKHVTGAGKGHLIGWEMRSGKTLAGLLALMLYSIYTGERSLFLARPANVADVVQQLARFLPLALPFYRVVSAEPVPTCVGNRCSTWLVDPESSSIVINPYAFAEFKELIAFSSATELAEMSAVYTREFATYLSSARKELANSSAVIGELVENGDPALTPVLLMPGLSDDVRLALYRYLSDLIESRDALAGEEAEERTARWRAFWEKVGAVLKQLHSERLEYELFRDRLDDCNIRGELVVSSKSVLQRYSGAVEVRAAVKLPFDRETDRDVRVEEFGTADAFLASHVLTLRGELLDSYIHLQALGGWLGAIRRVFARGERRLDTSYATLTAAVLEALAALKTWTGEGSDSLRKAIEEVVLRRCWEAGSDYSMDGVETAASLLRRDWKVDGMPHLHAHWLNHVVSAVAGYVSGHDIDVSALTAGMGEREKAAVYLLLSLVVFATRSDDESPGDDQVAVAKALREYERCRWSEVVSLLEPVAGRVKEILETNIVPDDTSIMRGLTKAASTLEETGGDSEEHLWPNTVELIRLLETFGEFDGVHPFVIDPDRVVSVLENLGCSVEVVDSAVAKIDFRLDEGVGTLKHTLRKLLFEIASGMAKSGEVVAGKLRKILFDAAAADYRHGPVSAVVEAYRRVVPEEACIAAIPLGLYSWTFRKRDGRLEKSAPYDETLGAHVMPLYSGLYTKWYWEGDGPSDGTINRLGSSLAVTTVVLGKDGMPAHLHDYEAESVLRSRELLPVAYGSLLRHLLDERVMVDFSAAAGSTADVEVKGGEVLRGKNAVGVIESLGLKEEIGSDGSLVLSFPVDSDVIPVAVVRKTVEYSGGSSLVCAVRKPVFKLGKLVDPSGGNAVSETAYINVEFLLSSSEKDCRVRVYTDYSLRDDLPFAVEWGVNRSAKVVRLVDADSKPPAAALVVDEVDEVRTPEAAQYRALHAMSTLSKMPIGMTGTPANGYPESTVALFGLLAGLPASDVNNVSRVAAQHFGVYSLKGGSASSAVLEVIVNIAEADCSLLLPLVSEFARKVCAKRGVYPDVEESWEIFNSFVDSLDSSLLDPWRRAEAEHPVSRLKNAVADVLKTLFSNFAQLAGQPRYAVSGRKSGITEWTITEGDLLPLRDAVVTTITKYGSRDAGTFDPLGFAKLLRAVVAGGTSANFKDRETLKGVAEEKVLVDFLSPGVATYRFVQEPAITREDVEATESHPLLREYVEHRRKYTSYKLGAVRFAFREALEDAMNVVASQLKNNSAIRTLIRVASENGIQLSADEVREWFKVKAINSVYSPVTVAVRLLERGDAGGVPDGALRCGLALAALVASAALGVVRLGNRKLEYGDLREAIVSAGLYLEVTADGIRLTDASGDEIKLYHDYRFVRGRWSSVLYDGSDGFVLRAIPNSVTQHIVETFANRGYVSVMEACASKGQNLLVTAPYRFSFMLAATDLLSVLVDDAAVTGRVHHVVIRVPDASIKRTLLYVVDLAKVERSGVRVTLVESQAELESELSRLRVLLESEEDISVHVVSTVKYVSRGVDLSLCDRLILYGVPGEATEFSQLTARLFHVHKNSAELTAFGAVSSSNKASASKAVSLFKKDDFTSRVLTGRVTTAEVLGSGRPEVVLTPWGARVVEERRSDEALHMEQHVERSA